VKKASFFGSLARMSPSQRFVPFDFLELAGTAFADAQQRLRKPGRAVMVHDPGRALGAQNAAVDRVVLVAFDIANAAVAQMHANAATASAHVASCALDLVRDLRRKLDFVRSGAVHGHLR
jgi:cysteine synthase